MNLKDGFLKVIECTGCNIRKPCNEEIVEVGELQITLYYCKECCEYIKEIEKEFNE